MWIAANHGHYDVVKLLLKRGADATISCKRGRTPRAISIERGHCQIEELISNFDYYIYSLMRKKKQVGDNKFPI